MPRYGCFELSTTCGNCGQPAPVNGPLRRIICAGCHKPIAIPPDIIGGFLNEFENEGESLDAGEGRAATLMSGAGTYKYKFWALRPKCAGCGTALPEFDADADRSISCETCGASIDAYPAPPWLIEIVPSATQCLSPQRETTGGEKPLAKPDESSPTPVVMTCPQCGGALKVTEESKRILTCGYCSVDVYIPDVVWTRLHPAKGTAQWFVRFEGKTAARLSAERRRKDEKDEKAAVKRWKPKRKAARKTSWLKIFAAGVASIILIILFVAIAMKLTGYGKEQIEEIITVVIRVIGIAVFLIVTVLGALHMHIGYWFGTPGRCKRAMTRLAEKHGWKHEAAEYTLSMGLINAVYRGRDIEISPDDDYAIEVDLDDSPFYLKTEPPGYPPEGLFRFSTGDDLFDNAFPIRYASPAILKKMEQSPEFLETMMSPLLWLLGRWDRLAMLKLDWSSLAVHLAPGHAEAPLMPLRYLKPGDIEPLLEDMITAAKAIEAAAKGGKPVLPE
ncbi:MAG: hypothetical protein KA369_17700 [Spirochaetes bacterium]|nr:hypothetical protein [Spirochaetota bacterium]